jgi:MFS family permease
VNFIGTLGFSIVLPFLVTLVIKHGGNALVYGAMGATYSAFQLLGAPLLGRWSDFYGRRKILLLSQLGTLASWVIFLFAMHLPARALLQVDSEGLGEFVLSLPVLGLFLARALDGLTGGNVSVANAYLADLTTEEDRNRTFGKMAVAGNLGFILGPILGGLLGATAFQETLPVLASLVISLVACLVIAFRLPESSPCTLTESPERTQVRKVFGQEQKDCYTLRGRIALPDILALPHVTFLLGLYFLIFLAFNLFYTAFPVHAAKGLGWSITGIGAFFAFLGLTTVIVQGPVLHFVSRRLSNGWLTLLGAAILGLGMVLLGSGRAIVVYLAGSLFSLGNGLMWPSFLALLSNVAGAKVQGAVQGLGSSVGSAASIVGLILGGILYEALSGATFLASAGLFFLVTLLSFRLFSVVKSPT